MERTEVSARRSAAARRRGTRVRLALALLALAVVPSGALAQATNQITGVDPASAGQGAAGLLVTFTLDTDDPPAPPAGVMPQGVTLGSLVGASVTHASQHVVTAVFDVPAGEPTGPHDATVTFPLPSGDPLVFFAAGAFTVTAGADTPPSIVRHPRSRTAAPGTAVTLTVAAEGTPPLRYQWQLDGADLPGSTAASHEVRPVAEADAGRYRCLVTNDFGVAPSDEAVLTVAELPADGYPIVDTGQETCFDDAGAIPCPAAGSAFHGQDAQHQGPAPSLAVSADGMTVLDAVTGLTWQRSPDTDRDGDVDAADKLTWPQVQGRPAVLNAEAFAGFTDWRLPTIKELFSLIDFHGQDPSGCATEADCPGLTPFMDASVFDFAYGDTAAGERLIDSQWASSTLYVSTLDGELLFGVNFADGRIKGYGLVDPMGREKTFLVICVRGNEAHGVNDFVDQGDGTVKDRATGLTWTRDDSGFGMTWEEALRHVEGLTTGGHDDWRLPSIKELQGLVDYTRSPDTTASAAIDPVFGVTPVTNEDGERDFPYYWASTTHVAYPDRGGAAGYVAFGRGLGYLDGRWQDVHGAGCQRSDPKTGDPADYPFGHGPQGDAVRILDFVRAVRGPDDTTCELRVEGGGPTLLRLTPATPASSFGVVTGVISELHADRDFRRAACLGTFGGVASDPRPVPPLDGYWYLARRADAGAAATYGDGAGVTPDPRDELDASDPCP